MNSLRPAIFLDRDGTLIKEKNFLADPHQVELENGAIHALRRLSASGFALVIVSNQSGVARGIITIDDVKAVNRRISEILYEHGVRIDGWYYCIHHPSDHCKCRKPGAELALRSAVDLDLNLRQSFVIGDKKSDLELAKNIEAQGILVCTGHGMNYVDWATSKNFIVTLNLSTAADIILPKHQDSKHA